MAATWEGEAEFAAAFKDVTSNAVPVSAERIKALSDLVLKHRKVRVACRLLLCERALVHDFVFPNDSFVCLLSRCAGQVNYKMVVHEILVFAKKTKPPYRLAAVHVVDQVCRHVQRKIGASDALLGRFAKFVEEILTAAVAHAPSLAALSKVVAKWRENGIFPLELCDKLQGIVTSAGGPDAAAISAAQADLLKNLQAIQSRAPVSGAAAAAAAPPPPQAMVSLFDYADDEEDDEKRIERQRERRLAEERAVNAAEGAQAEPSAVEPDASPGDKRPAAQDDASNPPKRARWT